MHKHIFACVLSVVSMTHIHAHELDFQDPLAVAVSAALVAGTVYLTSKTYAHSIVYFAGAEFEPTRNLLNYYAQYSAHWSPELDRQCRTALKSEIMRTHHINRNRCCISIYYEWMRGRPAYYVESCYNAFPLLKYKKDLDWYIKRLRIIDCLRLYSNNAELRLLIDQLVYMRNIITSDHDYYQEEQAYALRPQPVVYI